jgi:cytochrome P450
LIIENLLKQLSFSRAMLHNEAIYPEPFEFNPDRFMKDGKLNPDIRNPGHATFGFGRRHASHLCISNQF